MNAIVAERLTKRYGDLEALDNVSFEVPAGQFVALLGPNGAGKTTTIEILEGFLTPTSGSARVLGSDPHRGGRNWRSRIGLVMQSTSLDQEMTVRDLLTAFGGLYPAPLPVREVLELVDLADEAETRFGTLSGGQQRRVDVAVGIIGRPEILFLDEPSTGLDPEARRHLWTGIERLAATGMTVLLTTHYMEEASQLANRLIVISSGHVLADTTPDELRNRDGQMSVRYRLPPQALVSSMPASLADHFDLAHNALIIKTTDVNAVLRELSLWADQHGLDLHGLEVGPPTLEDAYLAITGGDHDHG
ncbi:MAG TPA: ABC transporter ATP-binding protein [Streptosporangiaceae bacterium]|jgi:ABC-2 type transport system ATP-binding protein